MKLLFDQNLSHKLADAVRSAFPQSTHVRRVGLDRADDDDIWQFAKMHGFVIVTRDADYYDKLITRGFPPKLLWITGGNASTSQVMSSLMAHEVEVRQLESDPECGCLELRVMQAAPRAT